MNKDMPLDRRLSVAPMMDWTDRHDRYFLRLCAPHTLLYTEMVTTGAIIHGDEPRHLAFNEEEHPVALQLGGCEPAALAHGARRAEHFGYDEVNLNVGCPSDRVQSGQFGACLMRAPATVRDGVAAMRDACSLPVTVKTRLGVDGDDSYQFLTDFVGTVAEAGCDTFIVHARKAWLEGLSPKQNRDIPPLDYPRVYRLKRDFPHLTIVINGGIRRGAEIAKHLEHVDGVMVGREAYQNPFALAQWDAAIWGDGEAPRSRHDIVRALLPYAQAQVEAGHRINAITRHILGLFQEVPGARRWRRYLSEHACRPGADAEVIERALSLVPEQALMASG